mmetsp:Transcript_8918/g.10326  ORF Transcript_8918/g.10326 Transcript_8918/m.10326 type:complete len:275 (+) Transcript_8918:222-1046(+)
MGDDSINPKMILYHNNGNQLCNTVGNKRLFFSRTVYSTWLLVLFVTNSGIVFGDSKDDETMQRDPQNNQFMTFQKRENQSWIRFQIQLEADLEHLSNTELEEICSQRDFELVRGGMDGKGGDGFDFHQDYVDSAQECILQDQMANVSRRKLETEREQMISENEKLKERLSNLLQKVQDDKDHRKDKFAFIESSVTLSEANSGYANTKTASSDNSVAMAAVSEKKTKSSGGELAVIIKTEFKKIANFFNPLVVAFEFMKKGLVSNSKRFWEKVMN